MNIQNTVICKSMQQKITENRVYKQSIQKKMFKCFIIHFDCMRMTFFKTFYILMKFNNF